MILPGPVTFTQYPFPGSMVVAGTYPPWKPYTVPGSIRFDGIVVIADTATGLVIDPMMFQPVLTIIVSLVLGCPDMEIDSFASNFNQYPERFCKTDCTWYPEAESKEYASDDEVG